jgi:hypothetical protein
MAVFLKMSSELIDELSNRIDRAAYGRIRQLNVREDGGHIVLEGVASSFHDKQKAQEAAFTAAHCIGPIANRIQVHE